MLAVAPRIAYPGDMSGELSRSPIDRRRTIVVLALTRPTAPAFPEPYFDFIRFVALCPDTEFGPCGLVDQDKRLERLYKFLFDTKQHSTIFARNSYMLDFAQDPTSFAMLRMGLDKLTQPGTRIARVYDDIIWDEPLALADQWHAIQLKIGVLSAMVLNTQKAADMANQLGVAVDSFADTFAHDAKFWADIMARSDEARVSYQRYLTLLHKARMSLQRRIVVYWTRRKRGY